MRLQVTALSGFGLLFGVSFAGGHSRLLQTVVLAMHGEKETMSPKELNFKHFHGPQTVPCVLGPPDRDTQKSEDDGHCCQQRLPCALGRGPAIGVYRLRRIIGVDWPGLLGKDARR